MTVQILEGDCRKTLATLPDDSVDMALSSPPYYQLRDYKRKGQVGLEKTPEAYVETMVEIFREVRRVLADDGTLWLNIGDTYATTSIYSAEQSQASGRWKDPGMRPNAGVPVGCKPKDLIGIPWMVAFALRADGWYLRSDNIWAKPNGMVESVQDRPTRAHEYVFLFSKSRKYYYNNAALRTPAAPSSVTRLAQNVEAQAGSDRANGGVDYRQMKAGGRSGNTRRAYRDDSNLPGRHKGKNPNKRFGSTLTGTPHGRHFMAEELPEKERRPNPRVSDRQRGHGRRHQGFNDRCEAMSRDEQQAGGANLKSVWWLAPASYTDELCQACERIYVKPDYVQLERINVADEGEEPVYRRVCACGAHDAWLSHYAVMPEALAEIAILGGCRRGGTVLDPFGGAGTTGLVADRLSRNAVLCELNPYYAMLAEARINRERDLPMIKAIEAVEATQLALPGHE